MPHTRRDTYFYKLAWFSHFKHVAPSALANTPEALITAASLGTKKKRQIMRDAVDDVCSQTVPFQTDWRLASWPAESDPCLQVADYCTWAIQRSWERDETRALDVIRDLVVTQYNYFKFGSKFYY